MTDKTATKKGWTAAAVIASVIVADQILKVWVKTTMTLHETIPITTWFKICFIENNGMAYGMEIGSKLVLSLFRIAAIAVVSWYLAGQVRAKAKTGYIVCLALVVAGAAGNIIDCMLYGIVFSASSPFFTADIVPIGSGYAPFLMGKVVDMLYFPLIVTTWPAWMPGCGGEEFVFFSPVFNIADAAITVSVFLLILFYRKELGTISLKTHKTAGAADNTATDNTTAVTKDEKS